MTFDLTAGLALVWTPPQPSMEKHFHSNELFWDFIYFCLFVFTPGSLLRVDQRQRKKRQKLFVKIESILYMSILSFQSLSHLFSPTLCP